MEHTKAPAFSTVDHRGNPQSLKQYQGQYLVLYFYPKGMTPGCSLEAQGFQDLYKEFVLHNTQVLAVSRDNQELHQKFCDTYHLEFPLLMDTDGKICEAYGVWQEKTMFGKTYMGINRETFVIDPEGMIIKHWSKVSPANHPKEVLEYIESR